MNRKIAVRAIIIDNTGKLFCFRLKAYGGKAEQKHWGTPGGGVDSGEALLPALEREMLEETAVKPVIGNLLYIQQFNFDGLEQLEFFFHVTNFTDYQNIDLANATHAAEEIAEFDFVDPATTNLLPKFLATENIAKHIGSNTPAKIFSYL